MAGYFSYFIKMTKFNVISPIGGFGNHARWLMLLDDQFSFIKSNTIDIKRDRYERLAGVSWPSYEDFLIKKFDNLPDNIINEIINYTKVTHNFTTISSKIKFFEETVYSTDRSYHNWLQQEWTLRPFLNDFILFDHEYTDNGLPTLLLTVDPFLAYKSYVKFNINLNCTLKDDFLEYVGSVNQKHVLLAKDNKNILLLDSSILFSPTLDYNWYQQLVSFFNLTDYYLEANKIHNLWYLGHKRAENDIVNDMISLYCYK